MYYEKHTIKDVIRDGKILTVHELHIYELLEFLLRSVFKLQGDKDLNSWLSLVDARTYAARRSAKSFLKVSKAKSKVNRFSLLHRCSRLYKILVDNDVMMSCYDNPALVFTDLMHRIQDSYVLSTEELVKNSLSSSPEWRPFL